MGNVVFRCSPQVIPGSSYGCYGDRKMLVATRELVLDQCVDILNAQVDHISKKVLTIQEVR